MFAPATDTAATTVAIPDLCGPRVYTIVQITPQGFVSIIAPTTNLYSSNWTLSMLSTNYSDVGVWTVTVQAKLANYTGVSAATKAFTLTVVDPCFTAVIDNKGQTLSNMSFVARFPTPSTQTYIPFTDSVVLAALIDSICGPYQYTIVEGYSYVSLVSSFSGNSIDPW